MLGIYFAWLINKDSDCDYDDVEHEWLNVSHEGTVNEVELRGGAENTKKNAHTALCLQVNKVFAVFLGVKGWVR